jgi:hypothetical protein
MGDASGGEAAFGSHLLNERCTSGGPSSATANNTSCQENGCAWSFATFGADWVFAGMAASDIRNCLDSHNDHDDFAIGILSSESRYDAPGSAGGAAHASDGTQQFRYIKIDGHTPNLESVANGVYDFVEENVLNRLNTSFNGQSPPSGHKKDLADYVLAGFNSTSVIASLLISQAHGSTGGLAPALAPGVTPNAVPVSTSQLQANAVSLLTRSLNGPPQPCGPAIAVAPALSPFTHLRLNADTAANEK